MQIRTGADLLQPGALEMFQLPSDQRKAALDLNWLRTFISQNQEIGPQYVIEFLHKAELAGADPRRNQVYLIARKKKQKYKDQQGFWREDWVTVGTVVFAYQFFIAAANATGELEGFEVHSRVGEYFDPVQGQPIRTLVSTATVRRKNRQPVVYDAWYPEFVQTDFKTAAPTSAWQKPYIMLEKCALANAFRWAFPEAMSGMYISEEMAQATQDEPLPSLELPKQQNEQQALPQQATTAPPPPQAIHQESGPVIEAEIVPPPPPPQQQQSVTPQKTAPRRTPPSQVPPRTPPPPPPPPPPQQRRQAQPPPPPPPGEGKGAAAPQNSPICSRTRMALEGLAMRAVNAKALAYADAMRVLGDAGLTEDTGRRLHAELSVGNVSSFLPVINQNPAGEPDDVPF